MLSLEHKFLEQKSSEFPFRLAQIPSESNPTDVESPPIDIEGIVLSDQTRLGPYSWLLKDAFEESQSNQALQLNEFGKSPDFVAIGRSLTSTEENQGLRQQLITREKIALIVGADNPFEGTLTVQQVSQIFRGEITNWQQVGGPDLPLQWINRPPTNLTRQALSGYEIFRQVNFDDNAVDSAQDTTADITTVIGNSGISYTPASEAIEQFNLRIIPIDNIGVNDSRYPFSQPLYYVYSDPPSEKVQGFLDFLATPDAQSAIEFAQSQPASATRTYTESSLDTLIQANISNNSDSNNSDSNNSDSKSSSIIPAKPLEQKTTTAPSTTQPQGSVIEQASPTGSDGNATPWSWLPLLILFGGLGVLSWLAWMRVKLESKRKYIPRPAPDYAERLKVQGSNRDLDELKAIAVKPKQESQEKADPKSIDSSPVIPDLSLDRELDSNSPVDETSADVESIDSGFAQDDSDEQNKPELDQTPLWDEDQTTLQASPSTVAELDWDENELKEEDYTVLQGTINPTVESTAPPSPSDLESTTEAEEDYTLLQGVFQADGKPSNPSQEDLDDLSDATVLQGRDQLDPLTGQVMEADNSAEENPPPQERTDSTDSTDSTGNETPESPWSQISDPWT